MASSKKLPESQQSFADRIRICARIAGSSDKLAQKAAIPRRTLGEYLKGKEPKASRVVALARAAGVSPCWLLTGEDVDVADEASIGAAMMAWVERYLGERACRTSSVYR